MPRRTLIHDGIRPLEDYPRTKRWHARVELPPMSNHVLGMCLRFATQHRRCLLMVPHSRRNDLVVNLIGVMDYRRNLVLCHQHDRNFYPWSMYIPGQKQAVERYAILDRYMVAAPQVPMRLFYDHLAAYEPYWNESTGLAVADGGESWRGRSHWIHDTRRLRTPNRVMFSGNPFYAPQRLHQQIKWLDPHLLGPRHEWFARYVIHTDAHVPVGYQRAAELLQLINTIVFPPVGAGQLRTWTEEWVGWRRGRRDYFERLTDREFQEACTPRVEA